jgi:hypothetical protein
LTQTVVGHPESVIVRRAIPEVGDMPAQSLTSEIVTAAIDGYEAQKTRIDGKISELRAMLTGASAKSTTAVVPTKRRKMSAAGRKAISEATKKRWAAFHSAKQADGAGQAKTKVKRSVQRKTVAKAAPPAKAAKRRTPAKKVAKKTARAAAPASAETSA